MYIGGINFIFKSVAVLQTQAAAQHHRMVLEVEVNTESVKKLEKFLGTGKYKDLAVNTQSFSRKLNEERKMRIPYVDGQVGFIFHF